MSELPKLLPCPFCDGVGEYRQAKVVRYVACISCRITTKYTTWEEAAEIWNKRVKKPKVKRRSRGYPRFTKF